MDPTNTSLPERIGDVARSARVAVGVNGAEKWSKAQVQFSGAARVIARKALWFLRLVEPDSDERTRRHVQRSAARQLATLPAPTETEWCGDDSSDEECSYTGAFTPFRDLRDSWEEIRAALESTVILDARDLAKLEHSLERFVWKSQPIDPAIRLTYSRIPAAKQWLQQHLALILTLLVGLALCFSLEAVRSLVFNQPIMSLSIALVTMVFPWRLLRGLQRMRRHRGKAAPWNLGGRVVYALPASLEPERWLPWHPNAAYTFRVYRSLLYKLLLYVGLWVGVWFLYRAVILAMGWDQLGLTVYLIAVTLALLVLFASIIDFADMHSQAPLRGLVLAGALVMALTTLWFDHPGVLVAGLSLWLGAVSWWAWRVRHKRVLAVLAPLALVVTASVGMTTVRRDREVWRADTARVAPPEPLAPTEWPRNGSTAPIVVLAASGGGSRAAILTARTLAAIDSELPEIARNLQAISSVSGGSVANASYVARRVRGARTAFDSVLPDCGDQTIEDGAKQDFLRPTLLGVWWDGRGYSIERKWRQCPVGLGSVTIGMLRQMWRDTTRWTGDSVPFPIPLFNSASLDHHALVISPLDHKLFSSVFDAQARGDSNAYRPYRNGATWVYYRSGIYHLDDLMERYDSPLSAAVRASANFPFGFPLVELEATKPLPYSPWEADRAVSAAHPRVVRLTDGGALSNSGLWPLVPLLLNQRDRIDSNRGILLIVVDASRMPTPRRLDRQRGLLATILDGAPKGERLHLQMLQLLQEAYGGCFAAVQIAIEPLEQFNVHTTWALDRGSMQRVDSAFATAWPRARNLMKAEYDSLGTCRRSDPARKLFPTRVPLS